MGGGTRKIQEARRAPQVRPPGPSTKELVAAVGGGTEYGIPICERSQQLAFRIADGVTLEVGQLIIVVRGMPLAVVATQKIVGWVSDRRLSATLSGCLDAGYSFVGEVTTIDDERGDALAVVAGAKTRE
jgi:hypothetical protein